MTRAMTVVARLLDRAGIERGLGVVLEHELRRLVGVGVDAELGSGRGLRPVGRRPGERLGTYQPVSRQWRGHEIGVV